MPSGGVRARPTYRGWGALSILDDIREPHRENIITRGFAAAILPSSGRITYQEDIGLHQMTASPPENTPNQVTRLSNGRWVRGASGNPGGRPRTIGSVRDLARQQTELAISTLAEICHRGTTEMARITAARELLDRGWGKAPVAVEFRELDPEDFAGRLSLAVEQTRAVMAPLATALQALPKDQGCQSITPGEQRTGGRFGCAGLRSK